MTCDLLHAGFLASARSGPDRKALDVRGQCVTYQELRDRAAMLAATIQRNAPPDGSRTVAVFAERSLGGFASILGTLMSGRAYVPLNTQFPANKTRLMLQESDTRVLVVDSTAKAQLAAVLEGVEAPLIVLLPDEDDASALREQHPQHSVFGASDLAAPSTWVEGSLLSTDLAYLMFTSGSTGKPKGVMVTHANASHFVRAAADRYQITEADRFSQMFDTTFDLSVFDMFVAWERGASLHCPSRATLLNPGHFIREHELTVWFSVPSVALLMNRVGALKANRYPSLRWSLFCGERLPADLAATWATAAPASVVENLYGPTELTVACTVYRWDSLRSPLESYQGTVPIGYPFPGMEAVVVDPDLVEVAPGSIGELVMSGPQCTPGYWRNSAATDSAYVRLPGRSTTFYRTGDRVKRPGGEEPLLYVGRVDHQVKVRGHRVELGEVEAALRQAPGVESAAAVGWPVSAAGALGIAVFLTGQGIELSSIRSQMVETLPEYAVPHTIRVLNNLPINANGKIDRHALVQLLTT